MSSEERDGGGVAGELRVVRWLRGGGVVTDRWECGGRVMVGM